MTFLLFYCLNTRVVGGWLKHTFFEKPQSILHLVFVKKREFLSLIMPSKIVTIPISYYANNSRIYLGTSYSWVKDDDRSSSPQYLRHRYHYRVRGDFVCSVCG